jgi:hypothetical protein
MSTTKQDKPSNKSRQRSRKADRRGRKHDQEQNPKQQNEEKIGTALALTDAIATGEAADNGSIGFQTIANAYWSYARRSFQQTASLVEKLMGARSFDRAMDAQTEFTRQTCANLVAESQNICELYSRLANQIFRSWQGFAVGARNK